MNPQVSVSSEQTGAIGSCSVKVSEIKGAQASRSLGPAACDRFLPLRLALRSAPQKRGRSASLPSLLRIHFYLALQRTPCCAALSAHRPFTPFFHSSAGTVPGRFFPLVGDGWRSAGELSMVRMTPIAQLTPALSCQGRL